MVIVKARIIMAKIIVVISFVVSFMFFLVPRFL